MAASVRNAVARAAAERSGTRRRKAAGVPAESASVRFCRHDALR
ncbi:hypothetical protein BSLA_01r3752 [Burkholderia stabilis]|nr:hypothetical protein BSLA_01r3752 [Burkholderia stabilis]